MNERASLYAIRGLVLARFGEVFVAVCYFFPLKYPLQISWSRSKLEVLRPLKSKLMFGARRTKVIQKLTTFGAEMLWRGASFSSILLLLYIFSI